MFLLVDIVLSTLLRSGRELMLVRDTVWFLDYSRGLVVHSGCGQYHVISLSKHMCLTEPSFLLIVKWFHLSMFNVRVDWATVVGKTAFSWELCLLDVSSMLASCSKYPMAFYVSSCWYSSLYFTLLRSGCEYSWYHMVCGCDQYHVMSLSKHMCLTEPSFLLIVKWFHLSMFNVRVDWATVVGKTAFSWELCLLDVSSMLASCSKYPMAFYVSSCWYSSLYFTLLRSGCEYSWYHMVCGCGQYHVMSLSKHVCQNWYHSVRKLCVN